ncbi:hypothetical protein Kpol_1030p11, partial [Vanderwaltozyma polyspora DSM 70294]
MGRLGKRGKAPLTPFHERLSTPSSILSSVLNTLELSYDTSTNTLTGTSVEKIPEKKTLIELQKQLDNLYDVLENVSNVDNRYIQRFKNIDERRNKETLENQEEEDKENKGKQEEESVKSEEPVGELIENESKENEKQESLENSADEVEPEKEKIDSDNAPVTPIQEVENGRSGKRSRR